MKIYYILHRERESFIYGRVALSSVRHPLVLLSINTLRDKGLLKGSNDFLIDGEGSTGDEQQITELNSTADTAVRSPFYDTCSHMCVFVNLWRNVYSSWTQTTRERKLAIWTQRGSGQSLLLYHLLSLSRWMGDQCPCHVIALPEWMDWHALWWKVRYVLGL